MLRLGLGPRNESGYVTLSYVYVQFILTREKKKDPSVKSNIFPFYIWSEYGDEITVDKEPKLVRWNPTQKKIAQRVTMANEKQHNIKKTIEIKRWGTIFPSSKKDVI